MKALHKIGIMPGVVPLFALLVFTGYLRADTMIRIVTGNLSSGSGATYDGGHGARIFQGVKPDIVAIQEFIFATNTPAVVRAWVDSTFGPEFYYYRQEGAQSPNGIISRYPIISSGVWDDTGTTSRDFSWAKIDIPGQKDLWVISVHLLLTGASTRATEAAELSAYINANVPDTDYVVIGGDFNTDNADEAALTAVSSVVVTSTPYPADQNGNTNTNSNRLKHNDWILPDPNFYALCVPVVIGSSTYAHGLVLDSRVYTPLAEVSPVLYSDSVATNMQHMAVVRDFLIPTASSSSSSSSTSSGSKGSSSSTSSTSSTSSGGRYSVISQTGTALTSTLKPASSAVTSTQTLPSQPPAQKKRSLRRRH